MPCLVKDKTRGGGGGDVDLGSCKNCSDFCVGVLSRFFAASLLRGWRQMMIF